jgi:hypothetical protein
MEEPDYNPPGLGAGGCCEQQMLTKDYISSNVGNLGRTRHPHWMGWRRACPSLLGATVLLGAPGVPGNVSRILARMVTGKPRTLCGGVCRQGRFSEFPEPDELMRQQPQATSLAYSAVLNVKIATFFHCCADPSSRYGFRALFKSGCFNLSCGVRRLVRHQLHGRRICRI